MSVHVLFGIQELFLDGLTLSLKNNSFHFYLYSFHDKLINKNSLIVSRSKNNFYNFDFKFWGRGNIFWWARWSEFFFQISISLNFTFIQLTMMSKMWNNFDKFITIYKEKIINFLTLSICQRFNCWGFFCFVFFYSFFFNSFFVFCKYRTTDNYILWCMCIYQR